MIIRAKGWAEFQHYKGRNPPWIKLHRRLLDDYDYQRLPLASKALAPMLWLLASETITGIVHADPVKLAFRLRMKVTEIEAGLKPLIKAEFFEIVQAQRKQDASKPLADSLQHACPETETETETDIANAPSKTARAAFEGFWMACPRKVGRGAARKAFEKALLKTAPETIQVAMQRYAASRAGEPEQYTVHPATWLNAERWLDQAGSGGGHLAIVLTDEQQREERENLLRMGLMDV